MREWVCYDGVLAFNARQYILFDEGDSECSAPLDTPAPAPRRAPVGPLLNKGPRPHDRPPLHPRPAPGPPHPHGPARPRPGWQLVNTDADGNPIPAPGRPPATTATTGCSATPPPVPPPSRRWLHLVARPIPSVVSESQPGYGLSGWYPGSLTAAIAQVNDPQVHPLQQRQRVPQEQPVRPPSVGLLRRLRRPGRPARRRAARAAPAGSDGRACGPAGADGP